MEEGRMASDNTWPSEDNSYDFKRMQAIIESVQRDCEALQQQRDNEEAFELEQVAQELGHDAEVIRAECREIFSQVDAIVSQSLEVQQDWTNHEHGEKIDFDILATTCSKCCDDASTALDACMRVKEALSMFAEYCTSYGYNECGQEDYAMESELSMRENMLWDALNVMSKIQFDLSTVVAERLAGQIFECPICISELSSDDVFIIGLCGHKLCRGCAHGTVSNDLNCGQVPLVCPMCKANPCEECPKHRCPDAECDSDYCELLQHELETILSPEENARYQRVQLNIAVNRSGGVLVRCPAEDCDNIVGRDPNDSHCICNKCYYEWCENCHTDWHKGSTCEKFKKWKEENAVGDEKMEKFKQEGLVMECPNCHNWGMRNKGECNAITCLYCKGKFCWLCQKSLSHLGNAHNHFSEAGPCYGKVFEGVH